MAIPGMWGREGLPYKKEQGCLLQILQRTPKRYQDPVLWASNSNITHLFIYCHIFPAQYPKRQQVKAPSVDNELNTLRATKTIPFFYPKKVQQARIILFIWILKSPSWRTILTVVNRSLTLTLSLATLRTLLAVLQAVLIAAICSSVFISMDLGTAAGTPLSAYGGSLICKGTWPGRETL